MPILMVCCAGSHRGGQTCEAGLEAAWSPCDANDPPRLWADKTRAHKTVCTLKCVKRDARVCVCVCAWVRIIFSFSLWIAATFWYYFACPLVLQPPWPSSKTTHNFPSFQLSGSALTHLWSHLNSFPSWCRDSPEAGQLSVPSPPPQGTHHSWSISNSGFKE